MTKIESLEPEAIGDAPFILTRRKINSNPCSPADCVGRESPDSAPMSLLGAGLPTPPPCLTEGLPLRLGDLRSNAVRGQETRAQRRRLRTDPTHEPIASRGWCPAGHDSPRD